MFKNPKYIFNCIYFFDNILRNYTIRFFSQIHSKTYTFLWMFLGYLSVTTVIICRWQNVCEYWILLKVLHLSQIILAELCSKNFVSNNSKQVCCDNIFWLLIKKKGNLLDILQMYVFCFISVFTADSANKRYNQSNIFVKHFSMRC